jgi:hypothetical protein
MKTFKLFFHFHRRFAFNFDCDWARATAYEKGLDLGGDYICLSDSTPNISRLLDRDGNFEEAYVGYLAQTLATEYWILNHVHDLDFVGVTGYRRYPMFDYRSHSISAPLVHARATSEVVAALTSGVNPEAIHDALSRYDLILPKQLAFDKSVKSQYLETQDAAVWEAFMDGIAELAPEYKNKLNWFDEAYSFSAFGPMGLAPLNAYKEYADIYFKIVAFILKNVPNCFVVRDRSARYKTDRWIGYLAERFYPFFIFANGMTPFEVNTVELFE